MIEGREGDFPVFFYFGAFRLKLGRSGFMAFYNTAGSAFVVVIETGYKPRQISAMITISLTKENWSLAKVTSGLPDRIPERVRFRKNKGLGHNSKPKSP